MHIQKINEFLQQNGGNYLEIGVYYGETFFEVAKSNPSKKLYGIDPFIADGWTGQHRGTVLSEAEVICNQKLKEFPNAYIFKMTSKNFYSLPLDIKGFNVSVVYIDGSHWYDDVTLDIDLAIKVIGQKKGLVIFDDLHLHDVRKAITEGLVKYPQMQKTDCPQIYELGGIYTVN